MTIGPRAEHEDLVEVVSTRHTKRSEELVEEAERVVRPRAGLRVVLHAAGRHVERADALDRAVVEVDVRQLDRADLRLDPLARLPRHREAVVLRGDGDPAGAQVLDRVVGAAVAERELERVQPGRAGEQLVAEADAEHRLVLQQRADRVHDVVQAPPGRPGRARGRTRRGRGPAGPRRSSCRGRAPASRRASVKLRMIECLIPVSRATMRGPSPSPAKTRGSGVVTSRARSRPTMLGSASTRSRASRSGTSAAKIPPRIAPRGADVAHERARVHAGDPRDAVLAQPGQPALLGAGRVVGVRGRAHDRPGGVDAVGLHGRRGHAVVAHVRRGERDDLAGERRVGHRLLVARHAGGEHHLAGHRAGGADGVAVEARAVLQQDVGGHAAAKRPLAEGDAAGGDGEQHAARSAGGRRSSSSPTRDS